VLRRTLFLAAVALLVVFSASPIRAGETCSFSIGQFVILKSNQLDPDVFVWDARQRAINYSAGEWKTTQEVIDHTLLSKPGVRAIVISCIPEVIQARYGETTRDAVGLKLVNGPNHGRYGWVASDDAHLIATAASPTVAPRRQH
jgi:hypothetical protein